MREVTLEESKQLQLEMLLYVKKLCEEHNLRYYLAYGTLLGAVRHKGFIPWDDDVDIWMPREDYRKFIRYMKEDRPDHYRLVSYDTEKDYTLPLPKLIDTRTVMKQQYAWKENIDLGVYIDIFVLDGGGSTREEAVKKSDEAYIVLQKWYKASMKMFVPGKNKFTSFLKWVKATPLRKNGARYYLDEMERVAAEKPFYNNEYVVMAHFNGSNRQSNIYSIQSLSDGTKTLEFEGHEFSVPEKYEEILTMLYGDYMQLPPVEQRVSNHDYIVRWKN